jgi:hypothetical protein
VGPLTQTDATTAAGADPQAATAQEAQQPTSKQSTDALSTLVDLIFKEGTIGPVVRLVEKGTGTALLAVSLALLASIITGHAESQLRGADFGFAIGACVLLGLAGAAYNAYTYKWRLRSIDARAVATAPEVAQASERRDDRIKTVLQADLDASKRRQDDAAHPEVTVTPAALTRIAKVRTFSARALRSRVNGQPEVRSCGQAEIRTLGHDVGVVRSSVSMLLLST